MQKTCVEPGDVFRTVERPILILASLSIFAGLAAEQYLTPALILCRQMSFGQDTNAIPETASALNEIYLTGAENSELSASRIVDSRSNHHSVCNLRLRKGKPTSLGGFYLWRSSSSRRIPLRGEIVPSGNKNAASAFGCLLVDR